MREMNLRRPQVNQFAVEPSISMGRSQFNLSHGLKTTIDASYLYPILVEEVLPGDTFTLKMRGIARIFSPLDAPLMDNIQLESFFFFVPNRLLWENWQYFMGEHDEKGAQDTAYTIPLLSTGASSSHNNNLYTVAALQAHMGLPHGLDSTATEVSALPFRAYNQVYNHWFRSQDLVDEIPENVDDGPDGGGDYAIRKSGKKHDYFTSCLPDLQKGDAQSILGTTTQFDVETLAVEGNTVTVESGSGQRDLDSGAAQVDISANNTGSPLFVDLAGFAFTINQLREAVAVQRMLEMDQRGGTRYVELIKEHFDVTSPDFRQQNPEFLGGGSSYINITPIANTSDQDSSVAAGGADVYQGELRGIGAGEVAGHGFAKSFTEHGIIIGIIRARADLTYFQGLHKMWSRQTREEFYFPVMANLGEQSVLNKELFVTNTPATDDDVFGYQERWSEYRFKPSRIVGTLNPDATSAISFWHLAEDFSTTPTLNQTFIEDATPMSRVTTVDTQPDFLLDLWFDYTAARPIPVHSIPSLVGRRF